MHHRGFNEVARDFFFSFLSLLKVVVALVIGDLKSKSGNILYLISMNRFERPVASVDLSSLVYISMTINKRLHIGGAP